MKSIIVYVSDEFEDATAGWDSDRDYEERANAVVRLVRDSSGKLALNVIKDRNGLADLQPRQEAALKAKAEWRKHYPGLAKFADETSAIIAQSDMANDNPNTRDKDHGCECGNHDATRAEHPAPGIGSRPLGPEDFPPGTVVRNRYWRASNWFAVIHVVSDGIRILDQRVHFDEMEGFERSTDGGKTWISCSKGV